MEHVDGDNSRSFWFRAVGPATAYAVAAPGSQGDPSSAAAKAYDRIAAQLVAEGLVIVQERVFGCRDAESSIMAARRETLESHGLEVDTPITFVEGRPICGGGLAGVIVRAVRPAALTKDVWTLFDGGVPVGRGWSQEGRVHLILQSIHGCPTDAPIPTVAEQTAQMIRRAERLLGEAGATYSDTVRTWFYLRDILSWYDTFNTARSGEYERLGLLPVKDGELRLPASTGIEGKSGGEAAAILDLYAIVGSDDGPRCVEQLRSTAQRDAFKYGSAFSRGAIVGTGEGAMLQLSGTAAIDERGQSLHVGDTAAQIHCTLDRIESLLTPIGASLENTCAAVVFFKRLDDYPLWQKIAVDRGLASLPSVCVQADVCREELLFEIDAEIALDAGHAD